MECKTYFTVNRLFMGAAKFRTLFITTNNQSNCTVYGAENLEPLEHWDLEFEIHSRHRCISACFYVVLCTYRYYDRPIPNPRKPGLILNHNRSKELVRQSQRRKKIPITLPITIKYFNCITFRSIYAFISYPHCSAVQNRDIA
jgi:hypothetical protein